jgi:hypothetical protein
MRAKTRWGRATGLRLARMTLVPVAMAVSGCGEDASTNPTASATPSESETSAATRDRIGLAERLGETLELEPGQVVALERLGASWSQESPGPDDAWRQAAGIEEILTADQVAVLAGSADVRPMRRPAGRRSDPRGRIGGSGPDFAGLGLSDGQRAEIRRILQARGSELRALREEVRAGTLDRDAARAGAEAIRAETRARIDAVLTPAQAEEWTRRRVEAEARREERREQIAARTAAVRGAMAEALRLTDEQTERLAALRTAAGVGDEDRVGRAPSRAAHRAALEQILTEEQLRIVAVHRWLASAVRRGDRQGREAPRSEAGPGPRRPRTLGGFFGG